MTKLIDMDTVREEFDRLQRYTAPARGVVLSNKEIGLESILDEIKEILTFYSFDVPMVYGDGEETVEKAVLLEEVEYTIQSISDMRGDKE